MTSGRSIGGFYRHSVVRNASFLLVGNVVLSGLGFVFWIIAARLFPKPQIGVATVLLSSSALLVAIGLVGLDAGITRFLASSSAPRDQLDSTVSTVFVTTALAAAVYVLVAPSLSSHLAFLRSDVGDAAVFAVLTVALAVNAVLQNAFVAKRSAHFVLVSNSLFGLMRIALLPLLVGAGAIGIVGAGAAAAVLMCVVSAIVLRLVFDLLPRPRLQPSALRRVRAYASTLYAASLESALVVAVIPIVVLNRLGASEAANYYVVVNLATLLAVVASSAGQSLLAEGSHSMEAFHANVRRAVTHIFTLLLPAMLVYVVAGHFVLELFGQSYAAEGTTFLWLLTAAAPFGALNYVCDSIVNVRQQNRRFLAMNTINAGLILVLSVALVDHGLTGLGVAWLVAQVATLLVYAVLLRHELRGFVRGA
jgi:O-antigen/teichoic acid export membrane protein